jgi:hypothetical protein
MADRELIGQATAEQIAQWKNQHASVMVLEQEDPKDADKMHLTYVRKPTLAEVQNAFRHLQTDVIKTGMILLNTCRLGGSDHAHNDEEFRAGQATKMVTVFKSVSADLKEV